MMFDIKNYDYKLPPGLIAQIPAEKRDSSRLLVLDRQRISMTDSHFFDLPGYLTAGDLLVVNNTRVVPARLFGRKESGGKVEILVLEHHGSNGDASATRLCMLKSSRRPTKGSLLFFEGDISGRVREILENGLIRIEFSGDRTVDSLLDEKGRMPLPPYIRRKNDNNYSQLDRERYQTVFSRINGAVAAPTAGLHFTATLIERLKQSGVLIRPLTLHVGYGTFGPVRTMDIREHILGEESYSISRKTAEAINRTKKNGGRVIAVGTTVVRALESAISPDGSIRQGEGKTNLLVTPGFAFKVIDALITNFHLPKSSLLFLVSAFAGLEFIKKAYCAAVNREYRFYSYGDAMLIV